MFNHFSDISFLEICDKAKFSYLEPAGANIIIHKVVTVVFMMLIAIE